jgi:diguanylate cyclase (GGDEF)-like protein/PAS domain S-box-containing protein
MNTQKPALEKTQFLSKYVREIVLGISLFIYLIIFIVTYPILSRTVVVFYIIPLILGANMFGKWVGLGLGILSIPTDLGLFILIGDGDLSTFNQGNLWAIHGIYVLVGSVGGYFRDIRKQLEAELKARKEAEKALQGSENQYRTLVEQAGDCVYLTDTLGYFEYVNPEGERLTGYSNEELIGMLYIELIHPNWRDDVQAFYIQQRDERIKESILEFPIIKKSGEIIWGQQSVTLMIEDGEIIGLQGIVRDITDRVVMEQTLRKNEQRYKALFDHTNDAIFILDLELKHIAVNHRAADMLGYTPEELIGMHASQVVAPEDFNDTEKKEKALNAGETLPIYERVFVRKDGSRFTGEVNVSLVKDHGGNPLHFQSVVRDITEHVRTREQLSMQATAMESAASGIVVTDKDGNIQWVNPAFTRLTGYTAEEAMGENPRILKSGFHEDSFYKELWDTISAKKVWEGEVINRRKDGGLYYEEMTISPVLNEKGGIHQFVAIKHDVSARVEAEKRLQFLATHDPLTHLPNRLLFYDRLERAIHRAERNKKKLAVLFIDLDNFKVVNDHFGHEKGDQLLKEVADQLNDTLRASDTVARLAGDEFTIILDELSDPKDVIPIVEKILAGFPKEFIIEDEKVGITASIGISIFPDDGEEFDTLIQHADEAMYAVKEKGKEGYNFYGEKKNSK